MHCSPPGSSVHGISRARILEWVAISCSRGSSRPRDQTDVSCFSCIGKQILYHCPTWKALYINIQMYVYIHAHRHMHIQANISLFLKNLFTCHFIYFHLLLCLHPWRLRNFVKELPMLILFTFSHSILSFPPLTDMCQCTEITLDKAISSFHIAQESI